MNLPTTHNNSLIYYRLIAIWVLCEAMLGSIIFTFKIPVSGLLIGSCAVSCIALIAWYHPIKGSIIKATIIVAIFKMMLTPQAPPPAYVAVFFQGMMGELLFWNKKYYRLSCGLLAVLSLMESALQRIIVVTIIYGNDLWTAINDFLNRITGQRELTNYSFFIIFIYLLIHLTVGLILGVWLGFLPQRIKYLKTLQKEYAVTETATTDITTITPVSRKKKTNRLVFFIVWILLLAAYIQSYYKIGTPILSSSMALKIFIRSVIILLTWHLFLSPVLKQLLHKWLLKKKSQSMKQVQLVLNLLPSTQLLIRKSWQLAAEKKGMARLMLCSRIILANTFYTRDA